MTSTALMSAVERAAPVDWNRELAGAKMLMKSGLLPDSIKSPEAALFIILAGRDLGLSPVQSLRSIHIIKGKVEVDADQQLGLYHRAGGKSHFTTLTDTEAVLRLEAPWLIKGHEERFTMEDAKRAGLASSQNYRSYPKAMLRSRAITSGLKSIGFDPTAGVYDYGEIGGPEPVLDGTENNGQVKAEQYGPDGGQAKFAYLGDVDDVEVATLDADKRESDALAEIEELLPSLDDNQAAYVKHKLSDGADPVALLEKVRQKART